MTDGWTQPRTIAESHAEAVAKGYDGRPITWWEDDGARRRPGCTCGWKGEAATANHRFAQIAASHHARERHGYPHDFTWPETKEVSGER